MYSSGGKVRWKCPGGNVRIPSALQVLINLLPCPPQGVIIILFAVLPQVTKEEWKEEYYPTYCSGSAFILSTDVAEKLYKVSYHVPFFWVDDFYITGLLPLKAGNITHKQFLSTYVLNGDRLEELFTGPSWYLYIFSHLHDLDRIQAVWQKMSRMARGEVPINIKKALPGEVPNGTYVPLP